jgi:hypothetical protein
MNELETKNIVVKRIISHLNPVPVGAANELLQQPLADLGVILEKLISTRDQENAEEEALARIREAQTERAFDTAWGATLARVSLNGRYLCDVESNRSILESLLNPGELPTPAGYSTLVLQFPTKFSWQTPQSKPTKEDQRSAFDAFVRENNLSSVEANFNLFKEGASIEHFAGASGIERAQYANEQAQARQHFLIHDATPQQLKEEAQFQSATEREIAIKTEADRQHQFVAQKQAGLYSPLPTHNAQGEVMDGKYFKRISTLDYQLFKAMVRKHGSAQITERLRSATPAPAVPAV